MIRMASCGLMWVVLGIAVGAAGDVVVLQNGDRVEGEIVSETPTEVHIKRAYKSGNIKFTDKIERSRIARIEKGEAEAPAPGSIAAQTRPSASQPIALTDADRKELIKVALEQWEKQNYSGAGITLSKLINGSTKLELSRLSKEVESKIELSLGDMAAEAHLQSAIARSRGQGVVLPYVTDYEKPYLVPRLIDAYEEAMTKPVGADPPPAPKPPARTGVKKTTRPKAGEPSAQAEPPPSPAASQPVGDTYVLAQLLEAPAPFTGTPGEATAVARQIRLASSLLTARIKYDGAYKSNPDVKTDVDAKKKQLADLDRALFSKARPAASGREMKARPPAGMMGGPQQPQVGQGPRGPMGPEDGEQARGANQARKMINKVRDRQDGEPDEPDNEDMDDNR